MARITKVSIATVAALVFVASASAHFFGPGPSFVAYADGPEHTFCNKAANTSGWGVVNWARLNNVEPTDMVTSTGSCYTGTDVWAYSVSLPPGTAGQMSCIIWTGTANVCDQFRIDISTLGTPTNATGCHEAGHSVGLQHNNSPDYNGCMKSNTTGAPAVWGPDANTHVNQRY